MLPSQTPFQSGDKVVAYCRYSEGDDQGLKNTSTEEQEAAIRHYCDSNGLLLIRVFADPFASGRSVAKREKYLEMLSFLLHKKKPDVQGVILWDFERWGRHYDRAQYDAAQLRMRGYKLFSMMQPIVDNTPFSHVLEAMYFASAQNQSDMISADVKRALQANFTKHKVIPRTNIPDGWIGVPVRMGFYTDGRERIGYRAEPDPKYKNLIAEAVRMRLNGVSVSDLCKFLGGKFRTSTKLNALFEKPLLYGSMTYGGTTIEDYCEPIIDKQTYDRLQTFIASQPKRRRSPGGGVYSHNRALLSGLLVCGVCGERMHLDRRKAKKRTYETYYCNSYHIGIRRENIDDLIIDKAIDLLSGEQWEQDVECIVDALQSDFDADHDKSSIRDEITLIDRKLARLEEALEESDIVPKTIMKKMADLEAQREILAQKLDTMSFDRDRVRKIADKLRRRTRTVLMSDSTTTDEKREALQSFISEIVVLPGCKLIVKHGLPGYVSVADNSRGDHERPSPDRLILATELTYKKRI